MRLVRVRLHQWQRHVVATYSALRWRVDIVSEWIRLGVGVGVRLSPSDAKLAQGTVYLLLSRRVANRFAVALVTYMAVASSFVIATPLLHDLVEPNRLSGEVMTWQWVRLFSPRVNLYAVVFLIGGAIWSAWRYWLRRGHGSRVKGNLLIAVRAILPGIGGSFARAGVIEVLYVTELIGLLLIWACYVVIASERTASIHETQRAMSAQQSEAT